MDDHDQQNDLQNVSAAVACAASLNRGENPDLNRFSAAELQEIIFELLKIQSPEPSLSARNDIFGVPLQQYQAGILENMDEMVTLYDTELRHLWCNPQAEKSTGSTSEELSNRYCYRIWYERERPCDGCPVVEALNSGRNSRAEIETPDGQIWEIKAVPLHNANGETVAVADIRKNITADIKAGQAQRTNQLRMETLFQNIDDLVSLHDLEGHFLYHNRPSFIDVIEEDMRSKTVYQILDRNNAGYLKELADEVKTSGMSRKVELKFDHGDNPRWFHIHIHPVFEENVVCGFACVTSNITARKRVEKEIIENQARYHSIFENSPIAILEEDFSGARNYIERIRSSGITDFESYFTEYPQEVLNCFQQVKFTNANQAALQLYGVPNKQELLTRVNQMVDGTAVDRLYEELVALANGATSYEGPAMLHNLAGDVIHTVLRFNIPPEYRDTWERTYASIIDITEQVKANEALAQSQSRYHNIFVNSPIAIIEEDFSSVKAYLESLSEQDVTDFRVYFNLHHDEIIECFKRVTITAYNREAYQLFDRPARFDFPTLMPILLSGNTLERLKDELVALSEGKTSYEGTASHIDAKGCVKHTVLRLNIPHDYMDSWKRVYITMIDITERVIMENQLKASLSEKEYLLREVHHRVKNNLQVISSLLNLQANEVQDPQDLQLFRVSQDRVRSMALIHEKLYRSPNLSMVDFDDYLHSLTGELLHIFGAGTTIRLNVDAAGIFLPIDSAIPCGLIINELVTNALKYAFPDRKDGILSVYMTSRLLDNHGQEYRLTVSDNGIGFPQDINMQKPDTLGLQLINILTMQLNGRLEIDIDLGTSFIITFTIQ